MADINEATESTEKTQTNMQDVGGKARNMASRHPMRLGVAAIATIFGTGYLVGHMKAERQSTYSKVMRHISKMH